MASHLCLQCKKKRKRDKYTFCSKTCTKKAAKNAPRLLKIPKNHVMYRDVADNFKRNWHRKKKPKLKTVYLVTWTANSRTKFDNYVKKVERKGKFKGRKNKRGKKMSAGNERKLFRGAVRMCRIGEKTTKPCKQSSCRLCQTLRYGFGPYLRAKKRTGVGGALLGNGLYTSTSTSKTAIYARNQGRAKGSSVKVTMCCRVVLGRPFDVWTPFPFTGPPPGYNSVYWKLQGGEFVVYDIDAIRVGYLMVFS